MEEVEVRAFRTSEMLFRGYARTKEPEKELPGCAMKVSPFRGGQTYGGAR